MYKNAKTLSMKQYGKRRIVVDKPHHKYQEMPPTRHIIKRIQREAPPIQPVQYEDNTENVIEKLNDLISWANT